MKYDICTGKIWFDEEREEFVEMYFNPDSNCHGQWVINYYDLELVKDAVHHWSEDALDGECTQYLVDARPYEYEEPKGWRNYLNLMMDYSDSFTWWAERFLDKHELEGDSSDRLGWLEMAIKEVIR